MEAWRRCIEVAALGGRRGSGGTPLLQLVQLQGTLALGKVAVTLYPLVALGRPWLKLV